jgi:hypothetical protein
VNQKNPIIWGACRKQEGILKEHSEAGTTNSYGAGDYDAWLIKLERDGTKVWDKIYGGKLDDKVYSAQLVSDV